MDNENHVKKAISLSRNIQEHLNRDIIKEGEPFIVLESYEWLREVLSLLAKQSNLFEGSIVLLENNMEQEAYVLTRSQFNNMLWISYLCNDSDNARVKEYFYQPHITQLIQLRNIKRYLRELPEDTPMLGRFPTLGMQKIKQTIKGIEKILKSEGYLTSPLKSKSIFDLTEKNPLLHGLYLSFYNEASKFEHSDISTVKKYRNAVVDDVPESVAFTFELNRSEISLWKSVFTYSLQILFQTVNSLYNRIKKQDEHLFNSKLFEEADFSSIILNIKIAVDLIDSISE